jgi:hypothetical protein
MKIVCRFPIFAKKEITSFLHKIICYKIQLSLFIQMNEMKNKFNKVDLNWLELTITVYKHRKTAAHA